jgi:hypothetical protein
MFFAGGTGLGQEEVFDGPLTKVRARRQRCSRELAENAS